MLPIQKLYSSNERIFKLMLDGISHEESLTEMNNCNPVNWILGHLVYVRNSILDLIGLPPVAEESLKPVYGRGVINPDMTKAISLEILKKMYVDSQPQIMEGVSKLQDETVLEKVTFLGFHEAYHLGQISLWRKMLGKEGAIR